MKKTIIFTIVSTVACLATAASNAPVTMNASLDVDYSNVSLWRGLKTEQDVTRATLNVKSGGLLGTPIKLGATMQMMSPKQQLDPRASAIGVNASATADIAKHLAFTTEVGTIRNNFTRTGVYTEVYGAVTLDRFLYVEKIATPTVRYVYNVANSRSGVELELSRPITFDRIYTTLTPYAAVGVFQHYSYAYPAIRADIAIAKNLSLFGNFQYVNNWDKRLTSPRDLTAGQSSQSHVFGGGLSFRF